MVSVERTQVMPIAIDNFCVLHHGLTVITGLDSSLRKYSGRVLQSFGDWLYFDGHSIHEVWYGPAKI